MESHLLQRVLDISRRMAETRQLDPLLAYVMLEAIKLVGAERGLLVMVNSDGDLDFRVKRDQEGKHLEEDEISTSVLYRVIQTGEPVVIKDALADPNYEAASSVINLKMRSVMCVPLNSRGNTIGAIFVENRHILGLFTEESLPPLVLFANQAAISIENAILNDELEDRVSQRTAELKKANVQLEKSWMEAVDANRLRTVFLGNVAHDIRAPLALTITTLSSMKEGVFGPIDEEMATWVDRIMHATNHAADLIQDMFDLTKIEMGHLNLYPKPFELQAFLEEVYSIGKALPRDEKIDFHLEIPNKLPTITADALRVRQVLLNLITNALKFTREGHVTLFAQLESGESMVLIGVKDTGPGIPEDQLEAVFHRFTQLEGETSNLRQEGSGLGLAISRELVEMHNGRIWAENIDGKKGALFKFTLPLNPEDVPEKGEK